MQLVRVVVQILVIVDAKVVVKILATQNAHLNALKDVNLAVKVPAKIVAIAHVAMVVLIIAV